MDKFIDIDHMYEDIVLRLNRRAMIASAEAVLTDHEWELLKTHETALYRNELGIHSYTECQDRMDSQMVRYMWDYCAGQMEGTCENYAEATHGERGHLIARRIARALMIMPFGPDILLR